MKQLVCILSLLLGLAFAAPALAGGPVQSGRGWNHFANPATEQRYQTLLEGLRCLVCQDESLADSNAELAADLRGEIFQMMKKGQSNRQIKQYLIDRYGDYVLFKPPLDARTYALWFGPFVLVVLGLIVLVWSIRKRSRLRSTHISDEERARIQRLLDTPDRKRDNDV